jgi:hypothetical protein
LGKRVSCDVAWLQSLICNNVAEPDLSHQILCTLHSLSMSKRIAVLRKHFETPEAFGSIPCVSQHHVVRLQPWINDRSTHF